MGFRKAGKDVPNKFKQKNPINRATKTAIYFNEDSRFDFLTGFRKRKAERQRIAQQEIEEKVAEAKREAKARRREEYLEKVGRTVEDVVPEVAHLVEPLTYHMPEHLVTVTDMSGIDYKGASGTRMGLNTGESSDSDDSEEDTLVQRLGLNNYEAEAAKRFKADDIHSSDDDQKDEEGGGGDSRKKKEMARKRAGRTQGHGHSKFAQQLTKKNRIKNRKVRRKAVAKKKYGGGKKK